MSKFSSSLPTNLDKLIKSLPANSTVHSIKLSEDGHSINVEWENGIFETGLTVPIDFPLDDLKDKALPKGAWKAGNKRPGTKSPKPEQNAPQMKPEAKTQAPKYLSELEVESAVAEGKSVEFQGIEPRWQDFTKSDTFTDGYFYRLKAVDTVAESVTS